MFWLDAENGGSAQGMNFELMWSVHGRSDILYVGFHRTKHSDANTSRQVLGNRNTDDGDHHFLVFPDGFHQNGWVDQEGYVEKEDVKREHVTSNGSISSLVGEGRGWNILLSGVGGVCSRLYRAESLSCPCSEFPLSTT